MLGTITLQAHSLQNDSKKRMGFFSYITQDTIANKGNTKGRLVALLFRTASYFYAHKVLKVLGYPYLLFYKYFTQVVFSIELPYETTIGKGFTIFHGMALVVHENTVIGKNCILRQSTTIGNAKAGGKCPVIGDNVEIGCNVCIIGNIVIGDNVKIGAGAVVTKNIPSDSVAIGNPARVIKTMGKPRLAAAGEVVKIAI